MAAPFYRCGRCGHAFTVTAGTLFANTKLPRRSGCAAVWYVVNQENGVSALGVQRVLGLGSYRTVWRWLPQRRRAMVRPGRDRLAGTGEVDEAYRGGERSGQRGRGGRRQGVGLAGGASGRGQDRTHSPGSQRQRFGLRAGAGRRPVWGAGQPSAERRGGRAREGWRPKAIGTSSSRRRPSWARIFRRASLAWRRSCNAGLGAPIKERSPTPTWTTTGTGSRFGSTGAPPALAVCCSIG